jgi:ABC-type uncharacterized transport system involved in gliding motility auxiliary subunit
LFDPRFACGLEAYVGRWGIEVLDDRVVDTSPTGQVLGKGPTTPLVTRYGVHDITRQFAQPTYYPNARSLRKQALYAGQAEITPLLFSGEQSWSETDVSGRQVGFDAADIMGPLPLALASRLETAGLQPENEQALGTRKPGDATVRRELLQNLGRRSETEARLVVFGDSDFASNNHFNDMGNGNLFLNVMAWLSQDEDLIAVRPKSAVDRSVSLTPAQLRRLNLVSLGVLPGLIALAGAYATWRRRAQG